MKILYKVIFLTFTLTSFSVQSQKNKCDIEKIKSTNKNIENLNYKIVEEFLTSFDKSCESNVEFSQWSNEILFKVIENSPEIYFAVYQNLDNDDKEHLLKELRNPIHDGIDLNKISERIKTINIPVKLKNKYLKILTN